jgi:citrate synthase
MSEEPQNATLTLPDGRTFDFAVKQGTMGPPVIDMSQLYAKTGHFSHDPGFTSTSSCTSAITFIDGEEGELLYRGYRI